MIWDVNKATVIGRDHLLFMKNRQDYCDSVVDRRGFFGVVCDGCGEGKFTEFGACLVGKFLLNRLPLLISNIVVEGTGIIDNSSDAQLALKAWIENDVCELIDRTMNQLGVWDPVQKITFIDDYLLSTFIFCIITDKYVFIGNCGDGVIIVNDDVNVIDQPGGPHYLMYDNVPKGVLKQQPQPLQKLKVDVYDASVVDRVVIATDGLVPLVKSDRVHELYGTRKIQLQRKFNVWSKDRLFYDDTSCIVFEKVKESVDEASLPG